MPPELPRAEHLGSSSYENNPLGLLSALFVVCCVLAIPFISLYYGVQEYTAEVTIFQEIPEAIPVANIEEKLDRMEFREGFLSGGGAGVGGLGAVRIEADSPQSLRNLMSEFGLLDEPIVTSFGHPISSHGVIDMRRFVQRYLVFLRDRSGVIVYEKVYSHPEEQNVLRAIRGEDKITFEMQEPKRRWRWFGRIRGISDEDVFGK